VKRDAAHLGVRGERGAAGCKQELLCEWCIDWTRLGRHNVVTYR
jgi:hypothetical protein